MENPGSSARRRFTRCPLSLARIYGETSVNRPRRPAVAHAAAGAARPRATSARGKERGGRKAWPATKVSRVLRSGALVEPPPPGRRARPRDGAGRPQGSQMCPQSPQCPHGHQQPPANPPPGPLHRRAVPLPGPAAREAVSIEGRPLLGGPPHLEPGAGGPGSSPIQGCPRKTPRSCTVTSGGHPCAHGCFFHSMLVFRFVFKPVRAHWLVPQRTIP